MVFPLSILSPATPEAFRALFKTHAAGVSIITAIGDRGPAGFTVTSVTSVSAIPPMVTFSIMETSSCWPALSIAETVVIHFLDEDHVALAKRFASSGIDRFEGLDWTAMPCGTPRLRAVRRWARCKLIGRHPAGASHVILALLGEACVETDGTSPLLYHEQGYRKLGDQSHLLG